MHVILWASMEVDVLLDRGLVCFSTFLSTKAIKDSESESHAVVAEFHNNGEPDVKDHGSHNSVSHACEPALIEVRIVAMEEFSENWTLVSQVGIAEHHKETCVEKDANEHTVGNVFHLIWLSHVPHIVNDYNNHHSNHSVDYNNKVFDGFVHGNDLPPSLLVVLAYGFAFVYSHDIFDLVFLLKLELSKPLVAILVSLSIAEAL